MRPGFVASLIASLVAALLFGAAAARAKVPLVVADIAPVHALVAEVMAGVGEPILLVDGASDPHSFSLRPSQARALSRAALVVWIGPELTPWLGQAISGLGATGKAFALLDVPHTHVLDFADETGRPGQKGRDPHAWLDPENAALWLGAIAERLASIDPGNAGIYRANAAAAQGRVAAMSRKLGEELAPLRGEPIVVGHDAYGYFAERFGLRVVGALSDADDRPPSAGRMAALRRTLARTGARCIFAEPLHGRKLAETLAAGSSARVAVLDPTGALLTPGPVLYRTLLESLAQAVSNCVAGRP